MADIYAVVDKSKKKNRSPCKEERSIDAFISPLYDAVEADLESQWIMKVLMLNSVLARDGVYPRALPARAAATTAHDINQIAGKHDKLILSVLATNSPAVRLVYPLVSVVLVTMIGIVLHHIHSVYLAKSGVWLKVKAKANFIKLRLFKVPPTPETTLMLTPTKTSSHDPHKIVSKTVIHFREQLLESYTADS